MGNALIDKELIGEPRLYDLAMRLEAETLHVLLYRSGEPESIVYRAVPLDAPGLPPERRLEETVYNNPLLLSDFHKVTILVDTTRYAIIPDNATGGDTLFAEVLADRMLPDTADDSRAETLFTPMSPAGVTVAGKKEAALLARWVAVAVARVSAAHIQQPRHLSADSPAVALLLRQQPHRALRQNLCQHTP